MVTRRRPVLLFIAALLLRPLSAPAEPISVINADHEWSLLAGYGITHKGFGATRTQVQTADGIVRFGKFLSAEVARGTVVQGRHELLLELPLHLTVDPQIRTMTGGYIFGSWKFTSLAASSIYPYALLGGGILFNDLGLETQGTRLNYTYQGGLGTQYLLRPDLAVQGEWRYHHISNAGTADPNEPLNSSKFLFGVAKFF